MKFPAIALLLCAAAALLTPVAQAQPFSEKTPDQAAVVKGNDAFAIDLYQKLSGVKGNLFFSPFSVSTALGMTYGGARGQTADEMAKTLHFDLGQAKLHPALGGLAHAINQPGKTRKYDLTVANRLWGQQGLNFQPDFLQLTQDHYGAGLKAVDFSEQTEEARRAINAWVEEQTNNKIKELLKVGILSPNTRLVLTNAIYFKASWANNFPKDATKPSAFRLPGGETVQVPMMHQTTEARHYAGDTFRLLDLPYDGRDLSMVIILPKDVDGLAKLEQALTVARLREWMTKAQEHEVAIALPKFKITSEFELSSALKALGMSTAFTLGADFSGITTQQQLSINAVVHKAFVAIHENGTEAAAATAVKMTDKGPRSGGDPIAPFNADHPFLFLIRENSTGSILFMGRVAHPRP